MYATFAAFADLFSNHVLSPVCALLLWRNRTVNPAAACVRKKAAVGAIKGKYVSRYCDFASNSI